MKKLLLAALAAVSLGASAETITITGGECLGGLRYCSLDNDIDADLSISAPPGTSSVIVTLDGVTYSSSTGGGWNDSIDTTLLDSTGAPAHIHLDFTHATRRVNAGRAHYSVTSWYVVGGEFDRP